MVEEVIHASLKCDHFQGILIC